MSAQVLLSMIAPAAPANPQGSSADDVSAFEGLLAAAVGTPTEDDAATQPGAEIDVARAATAVMVAAAPAPVALVIDIIADAMTSPETGAAAQATPDAGVAEPATSPVPAGTTPAVFDIDRGELPPSRVVLPGEQKPGGDRPPTQPPLTPAPPTKTGAEAPPVLPPAPPPLRPLADRTSKSLDAGLYPQATATADPRATPAGAPAASSPTAAAPNPVAAPDATAPVARDIADAATGAEEAPAGEGLPPETTAATPAVHVAREAAVPTMSRAAIDATAQIAAQILKKLDGRTSRFEMALTPEELGRVDVKLDIDSEGRLAARLAFDNPAAAADLRGRVDELRRQLEQAGFHLAEDAFEFAERNSGSSAFDRGDDGGRDRSGKAFARASRLNSDLDAATLSPRWTPLTLAPSGVDMKV